MLKLFFLVHPWGKVRPGSSLRAASSPAHAYEQWEARTSFHHFTVTEMSLDGRLANIACGGQSEIRKTDEAEREVQRRSGEAFLSEGKVNAVTEAVHFALSSSTDQEFFIPGIGFSKDERAAFHREVRERVGLFVDSKSESTGPNGTFVLKLWRRKSIDSGRWDPSAPEYLRFVMKKEGATTHDAVGELADRLYCKPERFSYSGLKDKNAVTHQFLTIWRPTRQEITVLEKLAQEGDHGRLAVGSFEPARCALRPGGLAGNRFRLHLDSLMPAAAAELHLALERLGKRGFVNTFGDQRFGQGSVSNAEVGAALLRSDYQRALALLLCRALDGQSRAQAEADPGAFLAAVAAAAAADSAGVTRSGATSAISRAATSSTERKLLSALAQHGLMDCAKVLGVLPRDLRRLFVESWQSSVWNALAIHRIRLHGHAVVEGDLVLLAPGADSTIAVPAAFASQTLKSERTSSSPDPFQPEMPPREPLLVQPRTALSAWDLPHTTKGEAVVHSVTAAEAAQGTFVLTDIVLPLLGSEVQLSPWVESSLGALGNISPTADLVAIAAQGHKNRELSLKGSYRHVVVYARQLELLPEKLESADEPGCGAREGDIASAVLSFDLPPASYATELFRALAFPGKIPGDVEGAL